MNSLILWVGIASSVALGAEDKRALFTDEVRNTDCNITIIGSDFRWSPALTTRVRFSFWEENSSSNSGVVWIYIRQSDVAIKVWNENPDRARKLEKYTYYYVCKGRYWVQEEKEDIKLLIAVNKEYGHIGNGQWGIDSSGQVGCEFEVGDPGKGKPTTFTAIRFFNVAKDGYEVQGQKEEALPTHIKFARKNEVYDVYEVGDFDVQDVLKTLPPGARWKENK